MHRDGPLELPVERMQVLQFARAIGDEGWADDVTRGETLAPPTFTQTLQLCIPDYSMRPVAGRPWLGSGRQATGTTEVDTSSTLHAEQWFEYHAPLHVGTVLVATDLPPTSWTKEGRSGELAFEEHVTEFRDRVDGRLIVTSRTVTVEVHPDAP